MSGALFSKKNPVTVKFRARPTQMRNMYLDQRRCMLYHNDTCKLGPIPFFSPLFPLPPSSLHTSLDIQITCPDHYFSYISLPKLVRARISYKKECWGKRAFACYCRPFASARCNVYVRAGGQRHVGQDVLIPIAFK